MFYTKTKQIDMEMTQFCLKWGFVVSVDWVCDDNAA